MLLTIGMIEMKKIICLLLICACLSMLFGCQQTTSESSTTDNSATASDSQTYTPYAYEEKDGYIIITEHNDSTAATVRVPDEINGKPVKVLGCNAFYQHTHMTNIELPDTLTVIDGAPFYRCYSLAKVTIPRGVQQIDSHPFFRCTALTEISVDPENELFCAEDGILYNKDKTVLIAYPEGQSATTYTVPSTVTEILGDAFGYHPTALQEIIIPSSVVTFPEWNIFVFPEQVVLTVEPESKAEAYAKAYDIPYRYQ